MIEDDQNYFFCFFSTVINFGERDHCLGPTTNNQQDRLLLSLIMETAISVALIPTMAKAANALTLETSDATIYVRWDIVQDEFPKFGHRLSHSMNNEVDNSSQSP